MPPMRPNWLKPRKSVESSDAYETPAARAAVSVASQVWPTARSMAGSGCSPRRRSSRYRAKRISPTLMPLPTTIEPRKAVLELRWPTSRSARPKVASVPQRSGIPTAGTAFQVRL